MISMTRMILMTLLYNYRIKQSTMTTTTTTAFVIQQQHTNQQSLLLQRQRQLLSSSSSSSSLICSNTSQRKKNYHTNLHSNRNSYCYNNIHPKRSSRYSTTTTTCQWMVESDYNIDTDTKSSSHYTTKHQQQQSSTSNNSIPKVVLQKNIQSRTFRDGNQLIYRKNIDYITTSSNSSTKVQQHDILQMGDIVHVYVDMTTKNENNNKKKSSSSSKTTSTTTTSTTTIVSNKSTSTTIVPIGFGIYNTHSLYCIRLLCHKVLQPTLYNALCTMLLLNNNNNNNDDENKNDDDDLQQQDTTINHRLLRTIVSYHINAAIRLRQFQKLGYTSTTPTNSDTATTTATSSLSSLLSNVLYTDTYRLCNGEGDSMSGLAIDVIGQTNIVVMSSAYWCEIYKDSIIQILYELGTSKLLYTSSSSSNHNNNGTTSSSSSSSSSNDTMQSINVIWKTAPSRLEQDGMIFNSDKKYVSRNEQQNDDDHHDDNEDEVDISDDIVTPVVSVDISTSNNDDNENNKLDEIMVISMENGIMYETYPYSDGQKTGVYADQRCNRYMISQYCTNKRVLDLCCYTGGFSFNALLHGNAQLCVGVDSSPIAIATCYANAKRNNIHPDRYEFIQSDITTYVQQAIQEKIEYDIVILDPPKLAPSTKLLDKAKRKYHALNRDAISIINNTNGGLLLSCTCSAAMTQAEGGQVFLKMIQNAAQACGKHITLLSVHGAAPCHTQSPMAFPASNYLTAALFYVHPKL